MTQFSKKIFIGLIILAVLTPIGLYLPQKFKAGKAWGEWSTEKVKKDVGYTPKGMEKDANKWDAPIPEYSNGSKKNTIASNSIYYILSGFIGLGIIGLVTFALYKVVQKK